VRPEGCVDVCAGRCKTTVFIVIVYCAAFVC